MRLYEIAIVCLLLAGLAIAWLGRRGARPAVDRLWRWVWAALMAAAMGIHLVLESAHWQMFPAYLAAVLVGLAVSIHMRKGWMAADTALSFLLVAASCAASYVLPMFSFPEPTGSHAVGTRIQSMVDMSRMEDADPASHSQREVVVQFWYPAAASHNPRAPYRRRSETSLASSYQSVDWTHSRYDAPVAETSHGFPILVYNPGWNGRRTQDTMLTEELASHGYVVVAIDHPYNSGPVALADGRVIRPVPAPELFDEVTSEAGLYALINKEVEKETDDAIFVLDRVREMNGDPQSPFFHALDLTRVGAFGYSLGGTVAAEMALRNTGIDAVLDLDTPLYGEAAKNGIAAPFMLLCEDIRYSTPEELARMTFGQRRDAKMNDQDYRHQLPLFQRPGDYQIELHGSYHTSYQDGMMVSPLDSISHRGPIPADHIVSILRQYSVAFFDQSLRGIPSPLLAAKTSPFPEAGVLFSSPPRTASEPDR